MLMIFQSLNSHSIHLSMVGLISALEEKELIPLELNLSKINKFINHATLIRIHPKKNTNDATVTLPMHRNRKSKETLRLP